MLQHFVDVAKTEEFMLLPLKQVPCQRGCSLDCDPVSPWTPRKHAALELFDPHHSGPEGPGLCPLAFVPSL